MSKQLPEVLSHVIPTEEMLKAGQQVFKIELPVGDEVDPDVLE